MSAATGWDLTGLTELVNETEFGMDFYKEAVMANDTFAFAKTYGQVLTGAKNDSYKLPNLEGTATAQSGVGCGQNSVDQTTFGQTDLNMVKIKFNGQFCPHDLEPYWLASGLPAGQHYENMGVLGANILAETARQIAKKMAVIPYQGPTGADTLTYGDNWIALLKAATAGTPALNIGTATTTNGGSGGTGATGVFNIVEAMKNKFLSNVDTASEVFSGGIVIAMSPLQTSQYFENYRLLFGGDTVVPVMESMANGYMNTWIHPGSRIRIVTQNALGVSGHIIGSRMRNQVLAFDLASDATKIKVWYDENTELIKWRQRVKMGTAFRALDVNNVVYYGATT